MSRFNQIIPKVKLVDNLAGGDSYSQSKELELLSILLTSFVNDQFYRGSEDTLKRMKNLLSSVNPEFAAKAAVYARDKYGMRSITHVLASELASKISGTKWAKSFYDKIIVRLDDMTEISSYYVNNNTDKLNPKFPNSMKKGFASAFDRFDGYHLAKYKSENKEMKLVDIINLVHPIPTDRNKEAIKNLINGTLKNTDTWESKLSLVGQNAENAEDLAQLKADVWGDLITNKKIGYFAALRNLRNIINQAPEFIDGICNILTDENMVKSSRVLPFRFETAYNEITSLPSNKDTRKVIMAIDKALNISMSNVPKFEGETLIAIDVSRSMKGRASTIASLFGAVLAKANNCDVMTFATNALYENYNPNDSVLSIKNKFNFNGGGTNFKDIFIKANKKYDRIIILSDMQSWIGRYTPKNEYMEYKKKFECDPYIYSWDLAGYGTMQFLESKVFALAGFSEKVFDVINLMEEDKSSLINKINSVEF